MKTLGIILGIVGIVVSAFLFGGFIWMICLGALAHIFNAPSLAISFWKSVVVGVIFAVLFGGISRARN